MGSTPGPNPNVSESLKRQIREEGEAQRRTDGRCFKMKENRPKLIKSQENMRAKENGRQRALSNPSYPKGVLQNRERGRNMTAAKKVLNFISFSRPTCWSRQFSGRSQNCGKWDFAVDRNVAEDCCCCSLNFLGPEHQRGKRLQSLSGFKWK